MAIATKLNLAEFEFTPGYKMRFMLFDIDSEFEGNENILIDTPISLEGSLIVVVYASDRYSLFTANDEIINVKDSLLGVGAAGTVRRGMKLTYGGVNIASYSGSAYTFAYAFFVRSPSGKIGYGVGHITYTQHAPGTSQPMNFALTDPQPGVSAGYFVASPTDLNRFSFPFSVGTVNYRADVETAFNAAAVILTPGGGSGDPYSGPSGGHSGGGGGTGRFSRTGDTVGEHNVPTLSAVDAGFITLFAPTAGEMKALASYLWSDLFSIDTFKKIFANPMDAILGLSIVPVSVPTSGSASVKVGNISTGVSMTKASTQYVKLSCGSLEVEEYWGAYLDYSPYTKCEIYLPYIGVHELSVDDVMGKTVKVVYYIDILSGACTAEIYSNSTCLYSFVGQCSASIPITGNDWTNVINGVMQIGASIGSMVASGGLTAPISAGGVASGLKSVASASSTVTSSKPSVERSGSMSGAGGMLGQQTPYLIITWPRECIPADQNKYIGYPSYVTVNLGDIVGFNIVDSIHLENIPATSAELDEIESLLMNGVIF